MKETCHIPVMEKEVLELLGAGRGGDYLDCTLGGGGHTRALLGANPRNKVVAADRDESAVAAAREKLKDYQGRLQLLHAAFSGLAQSLPAQKFDGVLADLGLSSDQIAGGRGFAFSDEAPLDMRMDQQALKSAHQIVNASGEHELFVILKQGGVGSSAKALARAIVKSRPIENTRQLAAVIVAAQPGWVGAKKTHPATVAFQAIRMAVNDELGEIKALLELVPRIVSEQGRLAVITFHSLEDKVVTSTMRDWESGGSMPALWPGAQSRASLGQVITRKAVRPTAAEVEANPRARSAMLRVFGFGESGRAEKTHDFGIGGRG